MILIPNFYCIYVLLPARGHLFNMIIALDFIFSPIFFYKKWSHHIDDKINTYKLYEILLFI